VPKAGLRPYDRSGLRLNKESPGYFTVTRVMPGSPAELAGVETGDKVLAIDSRPASQMSVADAQVDLRGEIGSEIELLLERQGDSKPQTKHIQLKELLP
jgi:carboxyl-terminal processing protease